MAMWHVMYDSWQMECCGTPFSVGDDVAWPLALYERADLGAAAADWEPFFSRLDGSAEALAEPDDDEDDGEEFPAATVVRVPGLVALWSRGGEGAPERPVPAKVTGLLSAETHVGGGPPVPGVVRALRVVTLTYASTPGDSRMYEPVPGEMTLREVDTCPKWFADEGTGRGHGAHRSETGVLVTLETPDRDA